MDCLDGQIHPLMIPGIRVYGREISSKLTSGELLSAAASDVLEAGLARLCLLALRFGDDEGTAAQVFGLIKLFFVGQVEISLFLMRR